MSIATTPSVRETLMENLRRKNDLDQAFFEACRAGDLEAAKKLLAHGADPARVSPKMQTPLEAAIGYQRVDVALWLLEQDASLAKKSGSSTESAAGKAAYFGQESVLEAIAKTTTLKRGAEETTPPIFHALGRNRLAVAQKMVEWGGRELLAETSRDGRFSALSWAAQSASSVELLRWIVEQNACDVGWEANRNKPGWHGPALFCSALRLFGAKMNGSPLEGASAALVFLWGQADAPARERACAWCLLAHPEDEGDLKFEALGALDELLASGSGANAALWTRRAIECAKRSKSPREQTLALMPRGAAALRAENEALALREAIEQPAAAGEPAGRPEGEDGQSDRAAPQTGEAQRAGDDREGAGAEKDLAIGVRRSAARI